MSGMSLPVNRPTGHALLVAGAGNRARPLEILRELGFGATEVEDPYAAMTELCRRPLVYRAVILSLASLYREELAMVSAVKTRFPHVELWLAHTDGRQGILAEAMRLGADGLLADDGLHRLASSTPAFPPVAVSTVADPEWGAGATPSAPAELPSMGTADDDADHDIDAGPILTPAELRALLHEQSPVPPDED